MFYVCARLYLLPVPVEAFCVLICNEFIYKYRGYRGIQTGVLDGDGVVSWDSVLHSFVGGVYLGMGGTSSITGVGIGTSSIRISTSNILLSSASSSHRCCFHFPGVVSPRPRRLWRTPPGPWRLLPGPCLTLSHSPPS